MYKDRNRYGAGANITPADDSEKSHVSPKLLALVNRALAANAPLYAEIDPRDRGHDETPRASRIVDFDPQP